MIEVKNLVKRYGNHLAVDHLNFSIREGQIYGFLGPNGAGKTTTMNMMTGYLASTEGEIRINGHSILEEPEAAKMCIGYLPEMPPLYMDMTVTEYLHFAAELKRIKKSTRGSHIDAVMEQVKVSDMAHRLIRNLSKGYRQRVGLAQALLGNPPVIILDEPTVGLDPKQMIEIRDLIKSLGKNHTVILSSHILSEVSAVCDYVMILSKGRLVASDTPENLSHRVKEASAIELTVKAAKEKISGALSALADIGEVSFSDSETEMCVNVRIENVPGKDVRETLFYKMAEAECPILQMNQRTASLEDVFLELTESAQSSEPAEEDKR